jgi:O-antigen ligase
MGIFTKAPAAVGALLVWFPIVATIATGAIAWTEHDVHLFDPLMPAALFPFAFVGAVLLLGASLLARSRRWLILLGLMLMVLLLATSLALAFDPRVASDEVDADSSRMLAIASLAGYTLALVVVAVGGVLLVRDLLRRGDK